MLTENQIGYIYRILAHVDNGDREYQEAVSSVLTEIIEEALDKADRIGLSRCEFLDSSELEWARIYDFLEDEELENAFEGHLQEIIARREFEKGLV